MAILGGSPLGLIGVRSTPTRTGMSTFNAGNSRNVNVFYYNSGKDPNYNDGKGGMYSMLSHKGVVRPWPNVGKIGAPDELAIGTYDSAEYKGDKKNSLHQNSTYDTSLLNIIETLSSTPANLRPGDFAYLKDIGVYPNNRLMIARRFSGPVANNIFGKSSSVRRPIATLISWKPQDKDFLDITFGEEWDNAKGDFTAMINKLGEDFMGGKLGGKVGGLLGAVPLPGFTEQLQRSFLENIGVFKPGASEADLPAGDPNLIKIAKRRKTIPYGEAGSGLKCTISINMVCEYEQKFISGIDSTVAWKDILSNILAFGSSPSRDYGLSAAASAKMIKWTYNISTMVSDIATAIKNGLTGAIDKARTLFTEELDFAADQKAKDAALEKKREDAGTNEAAIAKIEKEAETSKFEAFVKKLGDVGLDAIQKTIRKYVEEVKGIVYALSGLPSTPWHITIGNPMRPIFCSGDMYLSDDVKLTLGPDLAFNDLPSRIKVEFTLRNARPLGIQEIMARFNNGYIRAIDPPQTTTTTNGTVGGQVYDKEKVPEENETVEKNIQNNQNNGESATSNTNAGDDNKNVEKTTENSSPEQINSDANSSEPTQK